MTQKKGNKDVVKLGGEDVFDIIKQVNSKIISEFICRSPSLLSIWMNLPHNVLVANSNQWQSIKTIKDMLYVLYTDDKNIRGKNESMNE